MNTYFVIAPDGQRYGPATVDVLNQWVQQGRLSPDSLLQDAASGAQIVARGVPGISFALLPQAAPPDANPYDMPSPVRPPAYMAYGSQPWHHKAALTNAQLIGAWICTFLAPPLIFFCWVGLGAALYGAITGFQLRKEGSRTAGAVMMTLNILWIVACIVLRVVVAANSGNSSE